MNDDDRPTEPPTPAEPEGATDGERPRKDPRPMIEATRGVTFRDFLIFQLKLVIDGTKDFLLFQVAIAAMALDLLAGRGKRPRLFYSVLRHSERFDLWLNLNGALEKLETGDVGDDGLFGVSEAGSDTLLGKLEQMVRGGDEPRGKWGMRQTADPEADEGLEG